VSARRPAAFAAPRHILHLAVCALALLAGCGGDGTGAGGGGGGGGTTSAPQTGTALFTFSVSNTVKSSAALVDPLSGHIRGALFKQEDVTAAGPIEGAQEIASVDVPSVDLTSADVSAESWQSEGIEPGAYVFLGFFDLDANGQAGEPDAGDPVTLPSANKFDIVAGEETAEVIRFDIVLN
jgi:hypothetical protein